MLRIVAGVDEVGRGPLAGDVVACSVVLPEGFSHPLVRDSKSLSKKQIKEAFKIVKDNALYVGVFSVSPQEIDEINILQATFKAMKGSIDKLEIVPDYLLIDGDKFPGHNGIAFECVIKGDSKYPCISAASIVAKYLRDEIMKKEAEKYPGYGWENNAGYGTKEHTEGIIKNGLSPIHRRSFCKKFLNI